MKPFKTLVFAATVLVAAFAGTAALAHTDEVLDELKAPNGGQLRMAGTYHLELVVAKDSKEPKDSPLIIYVTDHAGVKVPTAGGSGTAILLSGKSKVSVTLMPDGENRLKGMGRYASTPDMKAVVSIKLPGQSTEQARFTPMAVQVVMHDHTDHKH